jgi:glyoxylase-like metal-dependent hydrolase (beta-lactamase superfamily II)
MAGVVYSRLPGFFYKKQQARQELLWCMANAGKAPHAGWMREVYYNLARMAQEDGDQAKATSYLQKSGYTGFDRPITLVTPFSEEAASGHAFSPRRIAEVVPGRVYALSGFEFTEYYFVVSDDGHQLIGIDAGTRSDSARLAYEALKAFALHLPELTTIFITHSHWDHVGGHKHFRSLDPAVSFYARSNYKDQIARELDAPDAFGKQFFGQRFSADDVRSFTPDGLVDRPTDLSLGLTRIELIPVGGGETHDAMFINMPDLEVMFVGDFIMPYMGAPFVNEGDLQGLTDAIEIVLENQPKYLAWA